MGSRDKFSCLSNFLFQRFNCNFKEDKDLEKSIEDKIERLDEYNFFMPRSLYGKYKTIEDEYEHIPFIIKK